VAELGGTGRPLLYLTRMDEATANILVRRVFLRSWGLVSRV